MAISELGKRIIYRTEDGGVALVVPSPECLLERSIQEIAQKDVPEGFPYKIIDGADLPQDWTFRDAWEVDELDLVDGVGAPGEQFTQEGAQ